MNREKIVELGAKGAALSLALGMLVFAVAHGQGCDAAGEDAFDEQISPLSEGSEGASTETAPEQEGVGAPAPGAEVPAQDEAPPPAAGNRAPMDTFLPATKSGEFFFDEPSQQERQQSDSLGDALEQRGGAME